MDLGYGFVKGDNRVSKQKIQYWQHTETDINWKSFLWYMTQYITITDYDENSFVVKIVSSKQREYFYKKVIEYNDEIACYNYKVDRTDNAYKDNRGYKYNKNIMERLIK